MNKSILSVSVLLLLFSSVHCWAEEGRGQIGISTNIEDALIYVNGKKKATAGEGYTTIRLPEGDYKIKIEKLSDDRQWIYRGVKNIFVGADTSIKISIKTKKIPVAKDILPVPAKEVPLIPAKKPTPERVVQSDDHDILVEKTIPGLEFVLLKPGSFMRGSPYDEAYRDHDEDQPVGDSDIASSGKDRVARGGSWYNGAGVCRSANRGSGAPDFHNNNLGFRLVKSP